MAESHRPAVTLLPSHVLYQGEFATPGHSMCAGAYVITVADHAPVKAQIYISHLGAPTRVFEGAVYLRNLVVSIAWDTPAAYWHSDEPLACSVIYALVRNFPLVHEAIEAHTEYCKGDAVCVLAGRLP